jgi:hypothetical protein
VPGHSLKDKNKDFSYFDAVHLVSFSTTDFEVYQNEMINSAKQYGIWKSFRYTVEDLVPTEFYKKNQHIFNNKRGFGFWLWKPYFILESLKKVQDNEIIFYVDSGAMFISDPNPLLKLVHTNEAGFVAFSHWPVTISRFTKRDTFINLGCDSEEYHNANIIMAGIMLLRKNDFTISFVTEWLRACENIHSLSDQPNIHGKENYPDFISHREDQSIFSILIKKWNIETYRDPSKWGNFLKMPEFRQKGELVCYPWLLEDSIVDYHPTPSLNSPYTTIFELNRKQHQDLKVGKKKSFYEKVLNKFSFKRAGKV